jgi:hypothetical protein
VCRLCTPLEPVALCARCAARVAVDWEERGELGALRAFLRTLRLALRAPVRLGARLGGAGHASSALHFAALCAASGLLPLALVAAVPLFVRADPLRHGLRSAGFWGAAVSLVPAALVLSTLLAAFGVPLLAGWVWLSARLWRISIRYDVLVRAFGYGLSPLALPLLGPLILPIALFWSLLTLYGALRVRGGSARACASVACAVIGVLAGLAEVSRLW